MGYYYYYSTNDNDFSIFMISNYLFSFNTQQTTPLDFTPTKGRLTMSDGRDGCVNVVSTVLDLFSNLL